MYYILDGKTPVNVTLLEWGQWMNYANRKVAETYIGKVRVSTIFLGLDHSFSPNGKRPLIFETMIFGGKHSDYTERYSTWEEAEKGHHEAVNMVRTSLSYWQAVLDDLRLWLTAIAKYFNWRAR